MQTIQTEHEGILMIDKIKVRGARVHNLKNIDVDIPLHKIVGIAGVSGSGKSSLALGVLYAEGSRRYLEALSTYTRRRMTQAAKAQVDEVLYIPAALALHQRPGVPGIRSTFGTGTELLNSLRLLFSRLASHRCPNGHYLSPTLEVAAGRPLTCPVCGAVFYAPSAEELAFNSQGACRTCDGTGIVRTVDPTTLVPDESLSIDEGAVAPWNSLMWSLMTDVCRAMGVRTDVPFRELSEREKEIVFHGPAEKKHILYRAKNSEQATELDFTYFNAIYTVENALSKVKDEKGMKRVEKFLKQEPCPDCGGTRLSEQARAPRVQGLSLDQVCQMSLSDLALWVDTVPTSLPEEMRPMAQSICESFQTSAKRLLELGLGYLTLDRASSTLSTGERQRMQLARAVRNRTTGVLYVLDEPSIGLHPSNIVGLTGVMQDLIADGNSIVLVDHDTQILSTADWIIEMGPEAGAGGGRVIAEGSPAELQQNCASQIGPFFSKSTNIRAREQIEQEQLFSLGKIHLSTAGIHTVKPLEVDIPKGRLTVVTGVSGSGKTTLVLESLVPGLDAAIHGRPLPSHVRSVQADGIQQVKLIDATPIGINVRSTVATYANIHDELRKIFAKTEDAKRLGFRANDFSYNTGKLRCPVCDGTGVINLDVQFLPDVQIPCPECRGSRYSKDANQIQYQTKSGRRASLPELMAMDVRTALDFCQEMKLVHQRLQVLQDLGLGYLTLGEETPSLSGGEAQRLKLASEMGKPQSDSVFVFDEPTIGLHPLDVQTLLAVFLFFNETAATETYTVTFDSMGGTAVEPQTVEEGGKATKPADPTRDGYTFDGWYTDEACTEAYDFETAVTADITLYAGWTEVDEPEEPDEPDVDEDHDAENSSTVVTRPGESGGSGSETPETPDEPGTDIDEPETPLAPGVFTDVPAGHWASEAIAYVTGQGYFNGTSETTFGPSVPMSRAMLATVLWRMEGQPAPTGANAFTDVAAGQWYTDAVTWAAEQGIVTGTGNGLFDPNGNITREQLAVMLYRYAGGAAAGADLSAYPDASSVSSWAVEAMGWAVSNGILSGNEAGQLNPGGAATRAEVAQMLLNYSRI